MPLVPLRPVLDAAVQYGYAQGAFNVNAVAQAEAVIAVHEMFRSPVILQGADLANAFMGGRTDFQNGTLEDKKKGAKNIAEAVKKFAAQTSRWKENWACWLEWRTMSLPPTPHTPIPCLLLNFSKKLEWTHWRSVMALCTGPARERM